MGYGGAPRRWTTTATDHAPACTGPHGGVPKACLLSPAAAVGDPCAVGLYWQLPFWPCLVYMGHGVRRDDDGGNWWGGPGSNPVISWTSAAG